MLKPYLPLAAMTALLTAAATVAQPQTTTGADASNTASQSTSSDTATTGTNSSTSGTSSSDTSGTSDSTSSASGSTSGTSSTTGSNPGATTNQTGTMGTPSTTATTGSLQGQDATFLRKAVEGDRMEIASAQAALDSAQRTDTRNAARMILEDHRASSQKLQALASRKGWTLPDASDMAESDQAMNTASGSGSFDDRFMADQIRMHREAISLYRAQASSGSDPDLRQFARDQLPHLEHHLEMLQGSNTQK